MTDHLTGDPKRHDVSQFKESLTGNCLCGSISVTINDGELFTKPRGHICHCGNCRKVSGSVMSTNLIMEEEKVKIEDKNGTLKYFDDKQTMSGKSVFRYFCSVDGNPIMSKAELFPGKVILKTGMFPVIPTPEMESFAAHKHHWTKKPDNVISYKILRGGEVLEE